MRQNKASRLLAFCMGILLIGALIQAAGWLKGDRLVFPGVGEILRAFFRLLGAPKTWMQIGTTLCHLLQSLAVSTLVGTALGLTEGASDFIRDLLRPLMTLLRSIPMIVLVVIIMVLMKYRYVPIVATSLILIPMISEATAEGMRQIEPEYLDVYRMNSGINGQVIFRVYLPLMAGYLRQAYVNAVGMGLRLTVSTEYLVQTTDSLGKAVNTSSYFNEYADIYGYALIMILLVVLVTELPEWFFRLRRTKMSFGKS